MATASNWKRARRECRADQRRLPEGLRRDVSVIRREDLGHDAVTAILDDVGEIAARMGVVRKVRSSAAEPWSYVLPSPERDILTKLEGNRAYRRHVRSDVRSTLRTAHLAKIDPGTALIPEHLGPAAVIEDGVLHVRSSIGLGTATVLEAEPEAWDQWAAADIVDRDHHDEDDVSMGFDDERGRHIFVLGALAGGFARSVTAMGSGPMRITESDWTLTRATALPCVERRGFPEPSATFDAAVAVFPSPSRSGAANQRNIYGRSGFDPARLGPRRWTDAVLGYLGLLNRIVREGALLYTLLPLGVRDGRCYQAAPDLLEPIVARLDEAGFKVLLSIPTIEIAPVAQPFVGTARPQKVTLILKKIRPVEGL